MMAAVGLLQLRASSPAQSQKLLCENNRFTSGWKDVGTNLN